jgi:hypothetical protein
VGFDAGDFHGLGEGTEETTKDTKYTKSGGNFAADEHGPAEPEPKNLNRR